MSRREVAVGQVFKAVRRRPFTVLAGTAVTAAAILVLVQQSTFYQATAVLRLTDERRAVAAGVEQAETAFDRTSDPIPSLVPRLRSRSLLGKVVDSLGLQLEPVPASGTGAQMPTPRSLGLQGVRVPPSPRSDTLDLVFSDTAMLARRGSGWAALPYGVPVRVGEAGFTVPSRPKADRARLALVPRDRAIDRLLSRLTVAPLLGTDAVEVKFTDVEPVRAEEVANTVVEMFQRTSMVSSQEQARRRREFLEVQLRQSDSLVARAQADLSAFRQRRQLANSSDKLVLQQRALMNVDTRRGELQENREMYRSLLRQLRGGADDVGVEELRNLPYSPELAIDPVVGRLYQQLLVYRIRLDSLTVGPRRHSSTNPDVVQLRELVRASQVELARAVEAQLRSIDERERTLARLRTDNAQSLEALPALQAQESRLLEQVATLSGLADRLRVDYRKARMAEGLAASDIELVDLATRPSTPMGIPQKVRVALALALGLLLATVTATVLELRNKAIRAPEELEQMLQARSLVVIPNVAKTGARRSALARLQRRWRAGQDSSTPDATISYPGRPSAGADAFRLLYGSLTFGWGAGNRTLLVTSAAPQEGKTLVAANLGMTFAREGARVLLVDCDIRHPRLHGVFGHPREPGLVDALHRHALGVSPRAAAEASHDDERSVRLAHSSAMFPGWERRAGETESTRQRDTPPGPSIDRSADVLDSTPEVRSTSTEGLYLLPAGRQPAAPVSPLQPGALRSWLESVGDEYDVIILDTPPVLTSADAPILASLVDSVVLVVRAGQTDRESVLQAYQRLALAGASFLNVALNDPAGEATRDRELDRLYDISYAGA